MSSDHTHLYWAILLLVVAVVLPTVCLLWFMNQAVKNERLAIRQKLIDIYTSKAEKLGFQAGTMVEVRQKAVNQPQIRIFAIIVAEISSR